jgi:mono/diheme cytochrome c family protein
MKKKWAPLLIVGSLTAAITLVQTGCVSKAETSPEPVTTKKELSKEELVSRGQYLVTIGGCNDCHSPKVFGPHSVAFDSTRLMSGHPASDPLPPVDKKALQPGNWVAFSGDVTAYVGPWGMSFSANLTPDSATGIGTWTEEIFVKTLRTGKHLGQEGGRPIMPPMPWEGVAKMTDEDLKAVYTYLQSLPPINNRVPGYIPPTAVQ